VVAHTRGNEVAVTACSMSDRRLHPRSVFLAPASAQLRITVDADIEQWLDTRAVVISSTACACGDELLVHSLDEGGEVTFCTAIVVSCEPILGNPTRYRISLSFTPAHAPAHLDGVPVA
jgi:hypothetical protein